MRRDSVFLTITGTVIGQIVYYLALSITWWSIGGNRNGSFVGWISALVACAVNPFICAYTANRVTSKRQKPVIVSVLVLYFSFVLVCTPASNEIWLHASGYYSSLTATGPNNSMGETLAVTHFINIIGIVISEIFFIGVYSIMKWREKT